MKTFCFALFFLLFVTFAPYTIYNYGWAGVAATVIWTVIMIMGLGGAIAGEGILGGFVGVIIGFFAFVVITTVMALFEWYKVDHHAASDEITQEFCKNCFGGRVIDATAAYWMWVWDFLNTSHASLNMTITLIAIILCVVGLGYKMFKA